MTLAEELRSVRSLAFLFEKRFEDAFRFEVAVDEAALGRSIVPLTLHTLLENAVHHNVVTRERPLVVTVASAGDVLEVGNPRQPKPSRRTGGVGLDNLRRSYRLLEAGPFEIIESEESFSVRIPLLKVESLEVESYASRDRRG